MMKIAVAGTGMVVRDMLEAVRSMEQIEVTAIYHHAPSGDVAEELAAAYGIPQVYGDYNEMIEQSGADFIYVALATSAHYQYAKTALECGHHVIVEKPMCAAAWQTKKLVKIAQEKRLFLFEALTTLHQQNYKTLRESMGKVGAVRMVQCNFSQRSSRYDRYCRGDIAPAFDPAMGGGALYDINVYNINFVVDLFGMPEEVIYYANFGYNGVDLSGTVVMQYPTFYAVCTGAKDSSSPSYLTVQGDQGYICADGTPNELPKLELNHLGRSGVYKLNRYAHRMSQEFADFEQVWKDNDLTKARFWLETAVAVAETLDRIAESAGIMPATGEEIGGTERFTVEYVKDGPEDSGIEGVESDDSGIESVRREDSEIEGVDTEDSEPWVVEELWTDDEDGKAADELRADDEAGKAGKTADELQADDEDGKADDELRVDDADDEDDKAADELQADDEDGKTADEKRKVDGGKEERDG